MNPPRDTTTIRTIAYAVFTDEQGVRVRCCFCGAVLLSRSDRVEHTDIADFVDTVKTHPCYQPGQPLPTRFPI